MSEPIFSDVLYDCATECALKRQNGKCPHNFGDTVCNHCKLNVNRYIDADPSQVDLFMLQADSRAHALKLSSGIHRPFFAIAIAICLFFSWAIYKDQGSAMFGRQPQAVVVSAVLPTVEQRIQSTLRIVNTEMRRGVDVNMDRLVNCIDAALLFYMHFQDNERRDDNTKANVRIMLNRNEATGMHHLFNVVRVNGVWRAVEPQAIFGGHSSWWMRDIWGTQYDHTLNRDVTGRYLRFIDRRYR